MYRSIKAVATAGVDINSIGIKIIPLFSVGKLGPFIANNHLREPVVRNVPLYKGRGHRGGRY